MENEGWLRLAASLEVDGELENTSSGSTELRHLSGDGVLSIGEWKGGVTPDLNLGGVLAMVG